MSFSASVAELVAKSEDPLLTKAPDWSRVPLGRVARVVNGFPFKSEFFSDRMGTPVIRIRDVTSGRIGTLYSGPIPDGYWAETGDIVIGMDGDFLSRIWDAERALVNQRVCKLEPDETKIDKRFLAYVLPGYLRLINEETHSITVKHLSSKTIGEIPLPLPPLDEQRRIVAKLDSLLARSKRAREELERIPRLVERTKQAILEVISTTDIASSSFVNLDGSATPKTSKLRDAIASLRTGPFGSSLHKSDYIEDGIPVVNPMHINNSRITASLKMTVSEQKARELSEFRLRPGDVVIARRGVMGRCAVVGENEAGWLCGTGSMAIRPSTALTPAYLQLFLSSPPVVQALEAAAVGSTMTNLNQAILLDLDIRIPSIDEQNAMIRRIEASFTHIDKLASEATRATALLDRLDQATLAKAFRGELLVNGHTGS